MDDQQHQRARTTRNTSNNPDSRRYYGQSSQQQLQQVVINPPHNQQPQGQASIAASSFPPPGVSHGRGSQEDTMYMQESTTSNYNAAGLRPQLPTLVSVPIPHTDFSQTSSSGTQPQPVVTGGSTLPSFNSPARAQFQVTHTNSGFRDPGATTGGTPHYFPPAHAPADNSGVPQCTLPGCRQPRFFDNRVQQQLEYCRDHVYTAISRGFAAVCERCKELPALHDSKYCSGTCSNGADTRGQSHGQPSVGAVPQGFAAACQDCRRPMPVGDSNRRFCRQCENANRSHNISHR